MRRVLQPKWKLLIIVRLKYHAQIMFKTCYGSESFPLTFKKKRQTFIYLNSKFSSGYSRSQLYLKGFSHYPVRGQISFLGIKQKLKYLYLKQCRLNSWRVSKCLPFLSQVNTSPYHVKMRYTQRKRLRTRKWRRQVRSPHLLVFKH